jgi:hypothetical protein
LDLTLDFDREARKPHEEGKLLLSSAGEDPDNGDACEELRYRQCLLFWNSSINIALVFNKTNF